MPTTYVKKAGLWFEVGPDGLPIIPPLQGADDPDPKDPPKDPDPKDPADPPKDPPKEDPLGPGGEAALAAERKARRDAEKRAKEAEARAKKFEDDQASDLEKATKRAEEAEAKVTEATKKIRSANLLSALADEGLAGAKARAAARLLDDVEYDETTDEPTNLTDAIKAATAVYGEEMFKGATPKKDPPKTDPGGADPKDPDGPKLTADELEMAKALGMSPEEYAANKSSQPPAPKPKK